MQLRQHVDMLASEIGERNLWRYPSLQRAAGYIEAELRACGYSPVRQTYEVSRLPISNIEATLEGSSSSAGIIVVGAHYDTVGECPGANDNGTGVAALLELARRLAEGGSPEGLRHDAHSTIRFVAFVNEEPPFFQTSQMGSLVYANAARARGDRIDAMLSLETMGYYSDERGSQQYPVEQMRSLYPDVGNFIGFVSNEESAELLERVSRAFGTRPRVPLQAAAMPAGLPGAGWSDHWSFWQAGYPALMVTDTAPWRYPWYHTPHDTPDKIDFERFAEVVDGLEQVIRALQRRSAR
jgi:Zn-dependent M28 family amino/carboxypeptidase